MMYINKHIQNIPQKYVPYCNDYAYKKFKYTLTGEKERERKKTNKQIDVSNSYYF